MSSDPMYKVVTNGTGFKIKERKFDCRNDYYYVDKPGGSYYATADAAFAELDRLNAEIQRTIWVDAVRPSKAWDR